MLTSLVRSLAAPISPVADGCHLCFSTSDCAYEREHSFLFSALYPRGVSSVAYSEQHSLLLVTGQPGEEEPIWSSAAGQHGITAWRILSGAPHYKIITDYEQDTMVR